MRTAITAICIWALCACAAAAGSPKATGKAGAKFSDREGQIEFSSPSQNIGCVYTPAGGTSWYKPAGGGPEMSCDRVKPEYVNVRMGPSGDVQRVDNPGEQPCCSATNILAYGKSWKAGPFTCKSGPTGLACMRADGKGFALGKKEVAVR